MLSYYVLRYEVNHVKEYLKENIKEMLRKRMQIKKKAENIKYSI